MKSGRMSSKDAAPHSPTAEGSGWQAVSAFVTGACKPWSATDAAGVRKVSLGKSTALQSLSMQTRVS